MRMILSANTFGPAIQRVSTSLATELDAATRKNAHVLQATAVKGIASNSLADNPINPWPALTPEYAARKRAAGAGDKMLIGPDRDATPSSPSHDGGEMMRSIEVADVGAGVYDVGTNIAYARAQERGYAPRNLPARPFLGPALIVARPIMIENWKKVMDRLIGGGA